MADDDKTMDVDLWGNPVYRVKRKRGRPAFEWTQENSNKISMMLAMGWTNDRIAGVVIDPRTGKSISVPTLKRYFRAELQVRDMARDQLDAKRFMTVADQAFGGNVGAMRLLNQMVEKSDMMVAAARLRKMERGDEEPIGKKEKARREAELALSNPSDGWGDDLNPSRVN